MNKKAKQFIKHIEENMNKEAFAIKEVKDAMHTVLFYANVNLQEKKILQCLVVIDDSQDILLRLDLRSLSQVKKNEREKWLWRINELNKQYPVFKFYQDLMTKHYSSSFCRLDNTSKIPTLLLVSKNHPTPKQNDCHR